MALLNRFVAAKKELSHPRSSSQRRPHLSSLVSDVDECEKWRRQVISEISKNVSMIQNGSLGEHQIRDLNDAINKLLREKNHWERQIKSLGGPDYFSQTAANRSDRILDADGRFALYSTTSGSTPYYYFGAAKDLPGVRELFEKVQLDRSANNKNRAELYSQINADYYGYRDDEDGLLQKLEMAAEKKVRQQLIQQWKSQHPNSQTETSTNSNSDQMEMEETQGSFSVHPRPNLPNPQIGEEIEELLRAHVELPSQADIEKQILEDKKKELLAKYAARPADG